MKRIMITGALGQIETELVVKCREIYGTNNVLATDIREPDMDSPVQCGPFELLDVTDKDRMFEVARYFKDDTLMHMAALLSATAEKKTIVCLGFKYGRSHECVRNS
ncbi:L-threonine 3-dehydrogenase [Staphylococcus saccharolyticus]|uniref:L-threonine 3-dehydrogenase n=1 Tax=Staphylococcus saccharolyticus TaxID=33028 RepID=A0A380HAB2_9STAP|nr:L-threonine 3-dehydrogenase [Staphylococcus saccharolyticus]